MKLIPTIIFFISLTFSNINLIALNYSKLETYSTDKHLQMVVEIPAGTNKKIEYDYGKNIFLVDLVNQKERIIDFLSYPGNYGFIPSTLMNKENGGDGDALDVLLLSETLETGTLIDIIPIGMLVLEDSGENDSKIIAIPVKKDIQIIKASSYEEFCQNYIAIKNIIELWFLNYKGNSAIKFIRWEDEIAAKKEVDKWSLQRQ